MSKPPDLRETPGAAPFRKKAQRLSVHFARESGVCATLEGHVSYRAGDAIVTGMEGEQWPVERDKFATSYHPLAPIRMGEDGRYEKKDEHVLALRLQQPLSVPVGQANDILNGRPGDWLVQYGPGDYGVVRNDIFLRSYTKTHGKDG